MKKLPYILVTVVIEFAVLWGVSQWLNFSFTEYIFFISLFVAVIAYMFSSKGGILTSSANLGVQSQTGLRQDNEYKTTVSWNAFFLGTVLCWLLSTAYTVIYYSF